jgi:predicted RNase H-like HicB family nuclease
MYVVLTARHVSNIRSEALKLKECCSLFLICMQYQVFVQSHTANHFVASVVGIPNLSVEGTTEAEAIAKIKTALEAQLVTGKLITVEVDAMPLYPPANSPSAGTFATDATFDDWMKKLAAIRQAENAVEADQ